MSWSLSPPSPPSPPPQMITLGGDAELELVDSLDPFSEGIVFSVRPPKKSWKNISNLSGGEKTLSSLALVSSCFSHFSCFFLPCSLLLPPLFSPLPHPPFTFQVFALHHYKPSPLYVMDEIDAALDFKNVSIVAHYIKVQHTVPLHTKHFTLQFFIIIEGFLGGGHFTCKFCNRSPSLVGRFCPLHHISDRNANAYCLVCYCFCCCLHYCIYCLQERTKNAQFIIISLRNNMFELADRLVGIYKTDNCTKSVTINPHKLRIGAPSQPVTTAEA